MNDDALPAGDAKVLGRVLAYRDDDLSAPPMLIDLDGARIFGMERHGDGFRPKLIIRSDLPESWLLRVLVKPRGGPWLLLGQAITGAFLYRTVSEQEAAAFAHSRCYAPKELGQLISDRCFGEPPSDDVGDEEEIKAWLLRQQAEHNGIGVEAVSHLDALPPMTKQAAGASLPAEAWLSHTDLADRFELPHEALRKRLGGWRKKHAAGNDWKEVSERKPREPKYLYRLGAVLPIVNEMAAGASGETSG